MVVVKSKSKSERRTKWILIALFVAVLVTGIVIWQLPALMGGYVAGQVAAALTSDSQTASVDEVSLVWSGRQSITGVHIERTDGSLVADLDLSFEAGLIALARGGRDFGQADLSGKVVVAPVTGPDPAPSQPVNEIEWPAGLRMDLDVDDVLVVYQGEEETLEIRDLKGQITVAPTMPVRFLLNGQTIAGGEQGTISAKGLLDKFVRSDGLVDFNGASLEATIDGTLVPIGLVDSLARLDGLLLDALGPRADIAIVLNGNWPTELNAQAQVNSDRAQVSATANVQDGRLIAEITNESQFTLDPELIARLTESANTIALVEPAKLQIAAASIETSIDGARGALKLEGAAVRLQATLGQTRLRINDDKAQEFRIDSANLTLQSADVADSINVRAQTRIAGADANAASPFEADLTLSELFDDSGAIDTKNMIARGSVRGESIPTALLDAFADLDGWLVDAAGPMIDEVHLELAAASVDDDATAITLSAKSPTIEAWARASLDDGVLVLDGPGSAMATWSPEAEMTNRVAALLGPESDMISVEMLGEYEIDVQRLTYPLDSSTKGERPVELDAILTVSNARMPIGIAARETAQPDTIVNATVQQLQARLYGSDIRDVAQVEYQLRAHLAVNGEGNPNAVREPLDLTGTARVENALDRSRRSLQFDVQPFALPTTVAMQLVGEQRDLVGEALGPQPQLGVSGSWNDGQLDATGTLNGSRSELEFALDAGRARVGFDVSGRQRITPRLVELALNNDAPGGPRLDRPVMVELDFTGDMTPVEGTLSSLKATLKFDDASVSGLAENGVPAILNQFSIRANWPQGLEAAGTIEQSGTVSTPEGQAARISGRFQTQDGTLLSSLRGSLKAESIQIAQVERILGTEPSTLEQWLGASGHLSVTSTATPDESATAQMDVVGTFDRAEMNLPLQVDSRQIVLRNSGTLSLKADRTLLDRQLNDPSTASDDHDRWSVLNDPEIDVAFTRLRVPLHEEQSDSGFVQWPGVELEAAIDVSPWVMVNANERIEVGAAEGSISGASLGDGLQIAIAMPASTSSSLKKGSVRFEGTVTSGATAGSVEPRTVNAQFVEFPIAIADALAATNGRLGSVLGPTVNGTVRTIGQAESIREIQADLLTSNGTLKWEGGQWQGDVIRVVPGHPLNASLNVTEVMSETVLSSVHPLLYDIRKKSGPIKLDISSMAFPVSGDLRQTSAEFTIDLGLVQVPTDGILGELLGTFEPDSKKSPGDDDRKRVDSSIPPIRGKITNGSLTYDKFVMQSSGFEVTTTGSIDLVERKVDLLASVPLIGWKSVFADLTKITPNFLQEVPVNVPFYLVVRGPIDNPTIKPDPEGAQRVAGEFFDGVGKLLIDDLLKGIIKPGEKKKQESNPQQPARNKPGGGGG